MNPLVFIILVNYNGYTDTVDCIKSLKKITYDNYQIVVVDNGSTIQAKAEELSYIKNNSHYIESKKNLGFSGGNNLGIEYAKKMNPDFYLLLNNDTIVDKGFLEPMIREYKKNDGIGLVTGRIMFYSMPHKIWFAGGRVDLSTMKVRHIGYMESDAHNYHKKRCISFATGCLWLLPSSTINKIGMLEEDYFLYCEDTDYCIRVLNAKLKILYVGQSCIYHKVSASTGNESQFQKYYMIRNTNVIIKRFSSNRWKATLLNDLHVFKMMLLKQVRLSTVKAAYNDYMRDKLGKREN